MFWDKGRKIIQGLTAAFLGTIACLLIYPHVLYASMENITPNSARETYDKYIEKHGNKGYTGDKIIIEGIDYINAENVSVKDNLDGKKAVLTQEEGFIEWSFLVPEDGLYSINVEYYPVEGTGGNIERTILIDGKLPYKEAYGVNFSRLYKDETQIEKGINGDDIRPGQVEAPRWVSEYVKDSNGYFGEGLYFYLSKGEHTLCMQSIKEPMAIGKVILESKAFDIKPYIEVYKEFEGKGAKVVKGVLPNGVLIKQAEEAYLKSDPSLYPLNDNTSPANQPFSYTEKRINAIGGTQWRYTGQWISWKIDVPESGFYNIGLRYKQDFVRDIYCNRTLYIDGKIPFEECKNIHFYYDKKWKVKLLGDDEPFLFYLEKGEHEIKLKITTGDLSDVLIKAQQSLAVLNKVNLDLIAFMGATPDADRDYRVEKYMPEVLDILEEQAVVIDSIINELVSKTGNRDSLISELEQLSNQMKEIVKKPYKIASLFGRFRTNVGALGNWIMEVKEHPVTLDYIFLAEAGAKLPRAEATFFENLKAAVMDFINSFSEDYLTAYDKSTDRKPITVWIGSGLTGGRDQAMTLSKLINQQFTAKTGIPVNLQLVPEATILSATLAGRAPDVALQLRSANTAEGQSITPVEFAMRNAVYDLGKFEDFDEIAGRFPDSALTPYQYMGGTYALPETFVYPMMFYRSDILSDLNIDINRIKTWQDVIDILPVLQAKNMSFGLPSGTGTYPIFLYQMGGEFYHDEGRASALDSDIALKAFQFWMEFYTDYGLIVDYSFENRFRTGEMPIGISDYTTYNLLTISAPEIKGLWGMTQIPGIKDKNGNINNVAPSSGAGCVLMSSSKYKKEAWEFMKWWTSAEIQYAYGRELEAVMGASARYNTANMEALQLFPWSAADRKNLLAQAQNLKGIPQVPGGYYTERNLNFARLSVLNKKTEPRETLLKYVYDINKELAYKRREFGLAD